MADPPRGTVTFLFTFTDIERSTTLYEPNRTAARQVVKEHRRIARTTRHCLDP
jgi:hypothetical protein